MSLTPEQQAIAERAIELIPACMAAFWKNFPCLREIAATCDLESAAQLACCKAARTYKPEKCGISAYFSVAIRNAFLKEIQKEAKSQSHSVYRITLQQAEQRATPEKPEMEAALPALQDMPEDIRSWIESYVFGGSNFSVLGREHGVHRRTAKKRLMSYLDKLRESYEDNAGS
jgi:DNA-directed RNA polymerase specialized sigma24 family protein